MKPNLSSLCGPKAANSTAIVDKTTKLNISILDSLICIVKMFINVSVTVLAVQRTMIAVL